MKTQKIYQEHFESTLASLIKNNIYFQTMKSIPDWNLDIQHIFMPIDSISRNLQFNRRNIRFSIQLLKLQNRYLDYNEPSISSLFPLLNFIPHYIICLIYNSSTFLTFILAYQHIDDFTLYMILSSNLILKDSLLPDQLTLELQIQDDNDLRVFSASIGSLEEIGDLGECFDSLGELRDYLQQPANYEIDTTSGTIFVVEVRKLKKAKTIRLGQIATKLKSRVIKNRFSADILSIKQIMQRCAEEKALTQNETKSMLMKIACGMSRIFDVLAKQQVNNNVLKAPKQEQGRMSQKIEELQTKYNEIKKQVDKINQSRQNEGNALADKFEEERGKLEKIINNQKQKMDNMSPVKESQKNAKQMVKKQQNGANCLGELLGIKDTKELLLKENLDLANKRIIHLPTQIFDLKSIVVLKLCDNYISELPHQFGDLIHLENLDLNRNKISRLPPTFGNLKELSTLWYSDNEAEEIPEFISELTQMQLLYIHNNSLTALPEGICNLKLLKTLWAYGNKLEQLPENLGELKRLKELQLQNNRIIRLPKSIGCLRKLEKFYLNSNKTEELPQQMSNMVELQTLWIEKNKLESLPLGIGKLKMLKDLQMHDNRIKKLPESFPQLWQLVSLKLSICPQSSIRLTNIGVESLKNLKKLSIIYHQSKQDIDSFSTYCHQRKIEFQLLDP